MNSLGFNFKGSSGSNKLIGKSALKLLVCSIKFSNERYDVIGRMRKSSCDKSSLLLNTKFCMLVQENKVRCYSLTKEKVL